MDISYLEPRLRKYGLTQEQVANLKVAAAKLPAGLEDGTLITIPQMPGLSPWESELFAARLLDAVAAQMGVLSADSDFLDELGFPTLAELVDSAQRSERIASERQHERA
jgi:hypothetical protein